MRPRDVLRDLLPSLSGRERERAEAALRILEGSLPERREDLVLSLCLRGLDDNLRALAEWASEGERWASENGRGDLRAVMSGILSALRPEGFLDTARRIAREHNRRGTTCEA